MDTEETPLVRNRLVLPPKFSRWHVAAFFLVGVAAAMPPISFITPKLYFLFKLRTVSNETHNGSSSSNMTGYELNSMQLQYESFVTAINGVAIALFNIITVFLASKIKLLFRLVVPFVAVVLLLTLSLILTQVNTDEMQIEFLAITLTTLFFMTGMSVVAFGSAFGFASILPSKFLVASLAGTGFGGVIVAIINILTLVIDQDPRTSALYFFSSAIFIVLAAIFVTYFTFRSPVVQFYVKTLRSSKRQSTMEKADEDKDGTDIQEPVKKSSIVNVISNKQIVLYVIRKTWLILANAFFLALVFGICFPALSSAVLAVNRIEGDLWSTILFVPVISFFLVYFFQFIGRATPRFLAIPPFRHWKWISLGIVIRFGMIPLYVYSNVQPRTSNWPVVFSADYWPAIFNVVLGLSNGYFGGLITLYLPKLVTGELKEHASIMLVAVNALGQMTGGLVSVAFLHMVNK